MAGRALGDPRDGQVAGSVRSGQLGKIADTIYAARCCMLEMCMHALSLLVESDTSPGVAMQSLVPLEVDVTR
jgi:hypothetical protein